MASLMRSAALRPAPLRASRTCTPIRPSHLVSQLSPTQAVVRRDVRVLASADKAEDFDAILAKWADQFEKADNKPAIVGYLSAAVGAVIFAEWFIHLPALDILIGFPIQLLGLVSLPVLATRYLLDGKADAGEDAAAVVKSITAKLPGLKKD